MEALFITLDRQGSRVTLILAQPCCAHNWYAKGWMLHYMSETELAPARKLWQFLGVDDTWKNWSLETVGDWPALDEARLVNIETGEVLEAKGLDQHRLLVLEAMEKGWTAAEFRAKVQAYDEDLAKLVAEDEAHRRAREREIDDAHEESERMYGRQS
jgi:hypothetical protein